MVELTNSSDQPIVTGSGVALYAFDNETHGQVWEARDPNWTQKVELPPGGRRTWSFTWGWKDLDGQWVQPRTFTLFARVGVMEAIMSRPVEVTRIAVG